MIATRNRSNATGKENRGLKGEMKFSTQKSDDYNSKKYGVVFQKNANPNFRG